MLSSTFTVLATAFLAVLPVSASPHPKPISSYTLPGNNTFPEGVAKQANSPYFYTSSTRDGTIYRGDITTPHIEIFIPPSPDREILLAGMKTDTHNHLYIAGGPSGTLYIYNTKTRKLLHRFSADIDGAFLNDVVLAEDGTVYITDSALPYLYYVTPSQLRNQTIDQKLEVFTSLLPEFKYESPFNANGIVVTSDQKYLIVADWGARSLFRVSLVTKEINLIDLGGKTIGNPDGLLLRGSLLYSVNSGYSLGLFIDVVEIKYPYLKATPVRQITSPLLFGPATAAWDGDDLLVTNFQNGLVDVHLPFDIVRVSTH